MRPHQPGEEVAGEGHRRRRAVVVGAGLGWWGRGLGQVDLGGGVGEGRRCWYDGGSARGGCGVGMGSNH